MKFYRCFLVVFGAFGVIGGAWAQCCWCDAADRCDVGMVVVGYTLVNEPICESCDGLSGYTGCLHCDCYGYDHPCPSGVGTGAKCLKMDCPGSCTGYKVCYPWLNTDPEELIIGDCHLENNTCYSNTRACSDFPNHVEPVDGTTLSCNSENQHNQAIWQENQNAWYTRNCECKVENAEITGLFRCERAMSRAYVKDSNALVTSVNDDIVYTLDYTYCAKCHAGYLPNIVTGSNAHYFRPSGGNGNWGVLACGTKVTVPDYAPGCTINFNLIFDASFKTVTVQVAKTPELSWAFALITHMPGFLAVIIPVLSSTEAIFESVELHFKVLLEVFEGLTVYDNLYVSPVCSVRLDSVSATPSIS